MIKCPFALTRVGAELTWAVTALVAAYFSLLSNAYAENGILCDNPDSPVMFSSIRDHFIQSHGESEARPVTTFLKSGIDAIVFHQPATRDSKPIKVRIFETNGAALNTFRSKYEIPVLSVEPAPDKLVTGYQPSDSILTRLEVPERTFPLWHSRTFLVVGCSDDQELGINTGPCEQRSHKCGSVHLGGVVRLYCGNERCKTRAKCTAPISDKIPVLSGNTTDR